jgi:hypothetical protein
MIMSNFWPNLDEAVPVECEICADQGSVLVPRDDGTWATAPCPVCSDDPEDLREE